MKLCFIIYFYFHLIIFSLIKLNKANDDKLLEIFSTGIGPIFWNYVRNLDFKNELHFNFECASSLQNLFKSLKNGQTWSYKMIDSTSKAPSGLLDFTYTDFGDYDQCLETKNKEKTIFGKYCLASIVPNKVLEQDYKNVFNLAQKHRLNEILNVDIHQSIDKFFDLKTNVTLRMGFCIPSQCLEKDLIYLLNSALRQYSWNALKIFPCEVLETYSDRASQFSFIQKFCLYFILSWIATVLFVTLLDAFSVKIGYKFWKHFSIFLNYKTLNQPQELSKKLTYLENTRGFMILGELFLHSILWPLLFQTPTILHRSFYLFSELSSIYIQPVYNDTLIQMLPFTGGFAFAHTYLKRLNKNTSLFAYLKLIFRRALRLLPSIIIIISFIIILPITGSGPLFKIVTQQRSDTCVERFWRNIFLISNWAHPPDMCAPHTWSISSEFQLFSLGLFSIFLYNRNLKIGLCFNIFMIVYGTFYLAAVTYVKELPPIWMPKQNFGFKELNTRAQYLHIQTFANLLPYFSPLLTCCLIKNGIVSKNPFLKKIFKIIFIINLFACYSSSIWNIFEVQTSSFFNALYVVLIRICSNLQMSIFIIISGYNFSEVTSDLRKKKLEEASSINNNNQENNNNIVTSKAQVDRTVLNFELKEKKNVKTQSLTVGALVARLAKPTYFSHVLVLKWYYLSQRATKAQNYPNWISDIFGIMISSLLFGYLYFLFFEGPIDSIKESFDNHRVKSHKD